MTIHSLALRAPISASVIRRDFRDRFSENPGQDDARRDITFGRI
jgi:hypothetical protein